MANIYVRSGAVGTPDGVGWATAWLTLGAALPAATSADTIWVADDHAETGAAASKTHTFPATQGLRIICANTHVTEPPTGLATTATMTTTNNFAITFISGFAYVYGISFFSGTGAASGNADLIFAASNALSDMTFDACAFAIPATNTGSPFAVGQAAGVAVGRNLLFNNCSFNFGAKTLTSAFLICAARIKFYGCTLSGGNSPTSIFGSLSSSNAQADILVEACDLTGVSCTNLVNVGTWDQALISFVNCKLAFTNVTTGTFTPVGCIVRLHNSDNASGINYRFAEHSYLGDVVQSTAITKTGGATVDTVAYSWKMTASANTKFWAPLKSPPVDILNTATGSGKTATLDIVIDSATTLNDNDVWIEVDYLADSADPLGIIVTDRMSNILSTPAAQDSSSPASWSGTGGSPNFYRLRTPSFTPQNKGYVSARVCLAKASAVIYVDPVLAIA